MKFELYKKVPAGFTLVVHKPKKKLLVVGVRNFCGLPGGVYTRWPSRETQAETIGTSLQESGFTFFERQLVRES